MPDRRNTSPFGYPAELADVRAELRASVERDERDHEQILERIDRVDTKCDVLNEHISSLRTESAVTSSQVARVLVVLEAQNRDVEYARARKVMEEETAIAIRNSALAHRRKKAMKALKIIGTFLGAVGAGILSYLAR